MSSHSHFAWNFHETVDEEALFKELISQIEYNLGCWTGVFATMGVVDSFVYSFISFLHGSRDLSNDNDLLAFCKEGSEGGAFVRKMAKRVYLELKARGSIGEQK